MRSTNIEVYPKEISYDKLSSEFKLVKIKLSEKFYNYKTTYGSNLAFGSLHNDFKEQINRPYYFFSNQKGKEGYEPTLYILLEKLTHTETIRLKFLEEELVSEQLDWDFFDKGDSLHILMKLLLSLHFWGNENKQICQAEIFVYGKGNEKVHTACKITLQRDKKLGSIEFKLIPQARYVVRQNKQFLKEENIKHQLFYLVPEEGGAHGINYLKQVKRSYIYSWMKNPTDNTSFYTEPNGFTRKNMKLTNAKLPWGDIDIKKRLSSREYIVGKFQESFVDFLKEYLGESTITIKEYKNVIQVKPRNIGSPRGEGIKLKTPRSKFKPTGLPVHLLKTIYVFDNRLRKSRERLNKEVSLNQYIEAFQNHPYSVNLNFEPIQIPQFSSEKPLLILQDVEGSDFKETIEKGNKSYEVIHFLGKAGFSDPKKDIYRTFKNIPKQTINVNLNKPLAWKNDSNKDFKSYFEYNLFMQDKSAWEANSSEAKEAGAFDNKIFKCLNELYLKNLILNSPKIRINNAYFLPCFEEIPNLENYAFQYERTFLFFVDGIMQFLDLESPSDRQNYKRLLNSWGINFDNIESEFKFKYYEKKDFRRARFIFSNQGLAMEIEDGDEWIISNYVLKQSKKIADTQGLTGIYYYPISKKYFCYTVGSSQGLKWQKSKGVKFRRLQIYNREDLFSAEEIFEMIGVKFVQNAQYSAYPYPFMLIRLYNEIKV